MVPVLKIKQIEKKKILDVIEKISQLFNEKKNYRKQKNEINSKILINKQIIEEIKRRRDEGYSMYKDQMTNLNEGVTKKTSLVKQFQKKFSEVEIFIQRECQNEDHVKKYGKWKTFTIIPFMKKNEDILKKKCFFEEYVNNRKKEIEILEEENKNLKLDSKEPKDEIINNNKIIENNLVDNLHIIDEYCDKNIYINNKEIELMKCRSNIISYSNLNKSIIPTFKNKNPIKNLDVHINLFDQKEKNNEIIEDTQELAPPEDDNWFDAGGEGNISDIEKDKEQ